MKKWLCMLLCLVCLTTLSGCADVQAPASAPLATLPPAHSAFAAPADASGMIFPATVMLALPSRDGQTLTAQYVQLSLDHTTSMAETIVRALLSYPSNSQVRSLGGTVTLGLFGSHPVEVAGNVCTVNLSSSALQLDFKERYTLFLSLATTLSNLDSIRFVNILVADQAVSLDISGNLAAGSLVAHPGEELPVLWDQMDARRTPLGSDPSRQPLSAAATLYFPLAEGAGFVPETRNLTFSGQTPQQMTSELIAALSDGPRYLDGAASLPDLTALLLRAPEIAELPEGTRRVTLRFSDVLPGRLSVLGIDPSSFYGALVYTITTFVPAVGAVQVYAGDSLVTSSAGRGALGALSFSDGLQRRRQFSAGLMEQVTIYLAAGGRLTPVQRALPEGAARNPAELLRLLMDGPTRAEKEQGVTAVLPEGMDQTDLLGAGYAEGTLLINLSPRFERLIRQAGGEGEQLLCYSIVTTLCRAKGARRMQFFFNGQTVETLGGSLYWGGDFLLNPSLIDQTLG